MLKQPGCSGLLPILAPVLEWSSLELARGCPCGLRCRQISCVTQPSVRLNSGVTQRRFRPSLRSSPFHCGLTSNSHMSAASAWVQMAGRGPAGLEVQNDYVRIPKGSQVPSRVRTLPAPSHACALHGPTPSPAPSKPPLAALARRG